jgi:hypothetical protein
MWGRGVERLNAMPLLAPLDLKCSHNLNRTMEDTVMSPKFQERLKSIKTAIAANKASLEDRDAEAPEPRKGLCRALAFGNPDY